jgi:uncharacterized protein YggL (DUF469 family)
MRDDYLPMDQVLVDVGLAYYLSGVVMAKRVCRRMIGQVRPNDRSLLKKWLKAEDWKFARVVEVAVEDSLEKWGKDDEKANSMDKRKNS